MTHTVYLRSGNIVRVEADTVKVADQKNRVSKFYAKVDDGALNEHCVAIANDPEMILSPITKTETK